MANVVGEDVDVPPVLRLDGESSPELCVVEMVVAGGASPSLSAVTRESALSVLSMPPRPLLPLALGAAPSPEAPSPLETEVDRARFEVMEPERARPEGAAPI